MSNRFAYWESRIGHQPERFVRKEGDCIIVSGHNMTSGWTTTQFRPDGSYFIKTEMGNVFNHDKDGKFVESDVGKTKPEYFGDCI